MPIQADQRDEIERVVRDHLAWDARIDASNIDVVITDAAVRLEGTVPDHFARQAALDAAEAVSGDREVEDRLAIRRPADPSGPASDAVRSAVESVLGWLPDVEIRDRSVRVENGVVKLGGTVDALWKKAQAADAVRDVYGVIELENKLTVVPTRSRRDQEIAQDVEAALDRQSSVEAGRVTVEVNDGVVTLTGWVPSGRAKRAAREAALHTPGVREIHEELSAKQGAR